MLVFSFVSFSIHYTNLTYYVNSFLSILDNFYYLFWTKFIVDFGQDLLLFLDILSSLPDFFVISLFISLDSLSEP